jgi:hypothetical protein
MLQSASATPDQITTAGSSLMAPAHERFEKDSLVSLRCSIHYTMFLAKRFQMRDTHHQTMLIDSMTCMLINNLFYGELFIQVTGAVQLHIDSSSVKRSGSTTAYAMLTIVCWQAANAVTISNYKPARVAHTLCLVSNSLWSMWWHYVVNG